ncbi:MAG: hypothetical protein LUQ37_01960, partial [Methanoregulaceae archaeon]|nr:hypothetical protein [Methanoregulaceae archaeon]
MVLDCTHHQHDSALFQRAIKLFDGFRARVIDIPDYQYQQTGPLQLAYLTSLRTSSLKQLSFVLERFSPKIAYRNDI